MKFNEPKTVSKPQRESFLEKLKSEPHSQERIQTYVRTIEDDAISESSDSDQEKSAKKREFRTILEQIQYKRAVQPELGLHTVDTFFKSDFETSPQYKMDPKAAQTLLTIRNNSRGMPMRRTIVGTGDLYL